MRTKTDTTREMRTPWQINRAGFGLFRELCPGFLFLQILNCIFAGIIPYFNIFMTAEIIDGFSEGAGREICIPVIITVVGNFIISVGKRMLENKCEIKNYRFMEMLNRRMVMKIQTMDYKDIESAEVRQLRKKIAENMRMNGRGTGAFIDSICCMVTGLVSIVTATACFAEMIIILNRSGGAHVGLIFISVLCLLLIINVIATLKYQKTEAVLAEKNAVMLAEENNMENALDCYGNGKDIRIYRQDGMILSLKKRYLIDIHWLVFSGFFKKIFRYETGPAVLRYVIDMLIYFTVCIYALQDVFGVGSIIKYVGFMKNMSDSIMLFIRNFTTLKFNTPFLKDFLTFFHYPSVMRDGTRPVGKNGEHKIEFRNVSFRYPGGEDYVLKDISLKIDEGDQTAIVGMNGSGKTTLIKLLCRLYDPDEGMILLNGTDIREYRYEEYIALFSAVFQDYKLFSFSLSDNLAMSEEADPGKAVECLELAGFGNRLRDMPKGLDTILYRHFDEEGVELSGGEAQKIAIARALYRDAGFVLLDEPTASLDPVSEHEIYQKFGEISKGKTVVYISHRLSSCRFCGKIIVLHEGRLVQSGSHKELLEDGAGQYAKLWNAQAQYYNG